MDIDERLQDYAEQASSPHEPWLAELSQETHRTLGSGQMLTGPVAGRLLEFLVWLGRPQRVLEIGSVAEKKEWAAEKMKLAQTLGRPFVAVINYDSAWRDPFAAWAEKQNWDLVIAEENGE